MIKEKEKPKIITAKIPPSLYAECEEIRDKLGTGTMNELVRRSLILFNTIHKAETVKIEICAPDGSKEGDV